MVQKSDTFHSFVVDQHSPARSIAYTDSGSKHSDQIVFCIPGILETRETFANLHKQIGYSGSSRVVSLDLCGRGDSDPISSTDVYSMKLYLSDLILLLDHIKQTHLSKPVKVHLLGTSMGGILAMYLAAAKGSLVSSVILNDVGLSLAWWSIYKLFGTMGKGALKSAGSMDVNDIAHFLNVAPAVVKAVQEPSHFDLPYKSDLMGMRFANIAQEFSGPILLIHAQDSVICTALQVDEFLKLYPEGNLLEVPGVEHPAPYNDLVCDFIISKIIQPKTSSKESSKNKPKSDTTDVEELEKIKSMHDVTDSFETLPKTQIKPLSEQLSLPLFSPLPRDTLDPLGLVETANKMAELNTQILNQFVPSASETTTPTIDSQQGSLIAGESDRAQASIGQNKKPILHRFRSAVMDMFKVK